MQNSIISLVIDGLFVIWDIFIFANSTVNHDTATAILAGCVALVLSWMLERDILKLKARKKVYYPAVVIEQPAYTGDDIDEFSRIMGEVSSIPFSIGLNPRQVSVTVVTDHWIHLNIYKRKTQLRKSKMYMKMYDAIAEYDSDLMITFEIK